MVVLQGVGEGESLLAAELKREGCRVEEVKSLEEVFLQVQEQGVDLLLVNEKPPEMPLLDTLRLIRGVWRAEELPVVVVTATEVGPRAAEMMRAGATDCVTSTTDSLLAMARVLTHLEQSRTERESRDKTDRAYRAAATAREVAWEWDAATGEVWTSRNWEALAGVSGEKPRSLEEWLGHFTPEDGEKLREELERLERNGAAEDFAVECRLRAGPAGPKWVNCRGKAERSGAGGPLRISGLLTDITQCKITDALTRLANRESLLEAFDRMLEVQPTGAGEGALLVLDLEGFRILNETMGHAVADALLCEVGDRLRKWSECLPGPAGFRPVAARLHGDRFALAWWEHGGEDAIRKAGNRVLEEVLRPVTIQGHTLQLEGRIGLSRSGESPGFGGEDLLREAMFGLGESKKTGQQRVTLFQPGQREAARRVMDLEADLRMALARKQMELFFQPLIELQSGKLKGFESLLRWRHPKYGIVLPGDFIPAAESSGLIVPIGTWVIQESARILAEWRQKYPQVGLHLSANLSVRQFFDEDLVRQVREAIRDWRLEEGQLCLEVTESLFMGDMRAAAAIIREIKAAGAGLMIDDFGTGYSSLYSVISLPFDGIKIDKSFIARMTTERSSLEVVRAIVSLASHLDMTVVAEGAETAEQVAALQALECGVGQGYYFSRPLPASEVRRILEEEQRRGYRPA